MMAELALYQKGVVGDLFETLGPVMPIAGEDCDAFVGEVQLHPVAVKFDFVDPAFAGRYLFDRRRQRRLDEAQERRLDANRRGLFALERHGQSRRIGRGSWISW